MKYDANLALKPYQNIRTMLEGIPRELWDILLPANEEILPILESNIVFFRQRARNRDQVMSIQRLCGFPLRPNESLRKTNIQARLAGLKKSQLHQQYNQKRRDADDGDDTAES